ncbi:MAG: ABC transporter ATP-binding protein [Spirochaetaceae bacterium]|jgi:iron complex transport system ATP-binding protein|nr:ABC transporter ATP-binding protein [Spirochaetaceae bacterium]
MIEVSNLSFCYKGYTRNKILTEVTMTAYPGEITAIIGANGIGKSTILKNICGLLKGSGGIKICGKNIGEYSGKDLASSISYLSQDTASNALLSVFEVVLLGRVARLTAAVPEAELTAVRDVLHRLNLEEYAGRNIGELSGGQRQLVFIAQALARNPKILIMDEPTSNLDLYYQFQIMNLLKELTVTENFTTLISLHQLDLVARFADKVIVISDGRVYDYGTPEKTLTAKTFRDVYRMNTEIINKDGAAYVIPVSQYSA